MRFQTRMDLLKKLVLVFLFVMLLLMALSPASNMQVLAQDEPPPEPDVEQELPPEEQPEPTPADAEEPQPKDPQPESLPELELTPEPQEELNPMWLSAVSNDDFDNAQLVVMPFDYLVVYWVNQATTSSDDPILTCYGNGNSQGYHTVWFKYIPPYDGLLKLNSIDSDFDTVLAVFSGTRGNLKILGCNDDEIPGVMLTSKLYVPLDGGKTYYIEAASYASLTQEKTLAIDFSFNPPKTFRSLATPDGWVLESTRTSNKGGSLNRIATTLRVGDDKYNRQYRSILHFNTADLPDNAVITSVKLQVKRASYTGTNPFKTHGALYVDMRKGAFSNNNALQLTDWQAAASKLAAGKIPKASASNWHTLNLAAANFKFINKLGVTQLRLRFNKQDNGDNGADYVSFYSGNAAAANRPKLIISYYVP